MSFTDINSLTHKQADTLAYSQLEIENLITQFSRKDSPFVTDLTSIKKQFEFISRKTIQYQLHSDTLIEYLRAKRIPRGLRVPLRPTFCQQNKEFVADWQRILNKCSLDLMTLTIKGIQSELETLTQSLTPLRQKLESGLTKDDFSNFLSTTEALLDKYKTDTLQFKLNKYRRDALDYEEDRVYNWREFRRTRDYQRPPRPYTDSDTSNSSGSQPAHFLDRTTTKGNKRRGQGGARGTRDQPPPRDNYNTRSQTRQHR